MYGISEIISQIALFTSLLLVIYTNKEYTRIVLYYWSLFMQRECDLWLGLWI